MRDVQYGPVSESEMPLPSRRGRMPRSSSRSSRNTPARSSRTAQAICHGNPVHQGYKIGARQQPRFEAGEVFRLEFEFVLTQRQGGLIPPSNKLSLHQRR